MPSETKISFSDGVLAEAPRKYSDDYSRKHLTDLVEADEESDYSSSLLDRGSRGRRKASTSSTFSVTSMDALWEKHPRKLSEAGLRRSSEHSVVLTEDTDSFIIGERVWVGGSKPGQIAYIGETQFAPGDWAGIVLDDPIGKNDGSVAGVRYFQCAERRGVFSRLTRLTRRPLGSPHAASPASDAGSVFAAASTPLSAAARQRRALSPNGSVRSAISSRMNMSVSSTAAGGELRLGDRVIVSSSQGSKAGVLRYAGPTDFAAGVWCGVELDDPIGKNDGSVEGKRYFECMPRFGLFAPAAKVSRSPSNRKPGACAIHSNGRLRRSTSRDSLTSLGTSLVSSVRTSAGARSALQRASGPRTSSTPVSANNALQEVLREKQQHLERLIRERELERAEVAKVTLQVDRVHQQLLQTQAQHATATSENEKLKLELSKLSQQLEDERQRAEELLFRTEEDNIHKEDYNKFKQIAEEERTQSAKRIEELEAELSLLAATTDTARASVAAISDKHTAEVEILTTQHKEEMQAAQMLSAELQKLLDEAYDLLKEKENEKDSLGKSMTEELSKVKAESEKALNEAKSKLAVTQTEFEYQLSVLNAKLQMAETKLDTEKQNTERIIRENSQMITDLNTKLTHTQAALDDKTHELNKVAGSFKEQELSLSKEILKLKMTLSSKIADLEELTENSKKYESVTKSLENDISKLKEDFSKKTNDYENILNETSKQNDAFALEIKELQQKLTMKSNELEKVLTESKDTSSSMNKLVKDYKELICEKDKEIIKLKHDFEEATANFNKNQTTIAEQQKKIIEERDMLIEKLNKEMKEQQEAIEKHKVEYEALILKEGNSVDEIKCLIDNNNKLNNTINELNKKVDELQAKISAMELQNSELERQLTSSKQKCGELQKAKEKVEEEYLHLTSNSMNTDDEIKKLSQDLRNSEKELQELRENFREKLNLHERTEQELNQELLKLKQNSEKETQSLSKSITETQAELKLAYIKIKELEIKSEEMKGKIETHETTEAAILNEKVSLEQKIDSMKTKEIELQNRLQDINLKSEEAIEEFKRKIDVLKSDGESSEVKLKEKVDQLVEAQNNLNNRLEQAQKNEEFLQKKLEEIMLQFNTEKSNLNKEISDRDLELKTIKEEIQKSSSDIPKIHATIQEKDNIIKDLNLKIAMLEVDMTTNKDIIIEKDRQISLNNQEVSKIIEEKQSVEQKLNSTLLELNSLKAQYDSCISEKTILDENVISQKTKIDKCNTDIQVLTKERSVLEDKVQELSNSLANINSQYEEIVKEVENNQLNKAQLSSVAQEKDSIIKEATERYLSEANKVKILQEEKDETNKILTGKNAALEEKEKLISLLQNSLQSSNSETSTQIENFKQIIEELKTKHKAEVESLQKSIKSLENSTKDNETIIDSIKKKDLEIEELRRLLLKSELDITKLTDINEGQKNNYEQLNIQLQADYDKLKKEGKLERRALREKLQEVDKLFKESKVKINADILKQNELQKKLEESEKRAQDLANKVELLTIHQQTSSSEQEKLLEKITLDLQAMRQSSAETLSSREQLINKLKTDVENKINDLLLKDGQIAKLEEELKNQKVKTELAQREKHLIQQEVASKEKDKIHGIDYDSGDKKEIGGDNPNSDRQVLDGQVEFLNSVIVDMQRKNEQLMARVHALETGFSSDATNDKFTFEHKKTPAPRLFCDICDVFDAHDTEDCPRQAGAHTPSPPASHNSQRKPPPLPRPYCDICEVFGHATENCDEEETF